MTHLNGEKSPGIRLQGGPSILIIDDDRGLRRSLSDILKSKGYETATAGNGADGLDLIRKTGIHLALIDLQLPDMSGIEVLKQIKSERPSVQTLILTGSATLDSAIEATNIGAFSYLQKPYDPDQLLLLIKRAFEKQQADAEIIRRSEELQKSNSDLKTLYDISLAVSSTLEIEKLFPEVLGTLVSLESFSVARMAAIYLVEEDRVRLFSHLGMSEEAAAVCNNLRLGDCLCGLAASTGEIIISNNSVSDRRHTRSHNCCAPHGHIVVPLISANKTLGVLCLFKRPDTEIGAKVFQMLLSIGNQLGIAIANSRLYEEAQFSSLHDPLTGLANRRLMDVMLHKSFARAARFADPLSLIMIDIDHFKKYNDTRGHLAGDKLLAAVAKIIAAKTREGDLPVRYGGEEFLMLLHQVDINKAQKIAEALRSKVETALGITISLGISTFSGKLENEEDLLAEADKALYAAKKNGRNRVEIATRERTIACGQY